MACSPTFLTWRPKCFEGSATATGRALVTLLLSRYTLVSKQEKREKRQRSLAESASPLKLDLVVAGLVVVEVKAVQSFGRTCTKRNLPFLPFFPFDSPISR
jgi:hypothetical protein